MLACCPTLNVLLEDDVKEKQGKYEGIYTFQGFSDGIDYWVDTEGKYAIWYNTAGALSYWNIGNLLKLGSASLDIYCESNTLGRSVPTMKDIFGLGIMMI